MRTNESKSTIPERQRSPEPLETYHEAMARLARLPGLQTGDLRQICQQLSELAVRTLAVERVGIWWFEASHSTLRCFEGFDGRTDRPWRDTELTERSYPNYFKALQQGEAIAVEVGQCSCTLDRLVTDYLNANGMKGLLVVPIWHRGELAGVVSCESEIERSWSLSARNFVLSVALTAAFGLEVQPRSCSALCDDTQQMLRLVVDSIPQRIFWKDRNFTYLGCNRSFARDAGYDSPEAIIGKTDRDLAWSDDEADFFAQTDRQVLDIGIYRAIEFTHRGIWVDKNKALLRNDRGETIGILGTYQDITELKEAEVKLQRTNLELERRVRQHTEQLQQTNEMLQLVMDNIPQAIFWKDRKSVYLGCNAAGARDAGFTRRQDIVGKTDYDLPWTREQADRFRASDRRVMDNDRAEYRTIEQQLQADGKLAWLEATKIPLHDETGRAIGVLVSYDDITERRAAETALRESEEKYRRIVDTAREGIWVLDRQERTTYVNPQMAQMLGYEVEGMLGRSLFEFVDESARDRLREHLVRRSRGISEQYDVCLHRADGSPLWAIVSSNPLYDGEGNFVGSLGMLTDITDRKHAEEALQRSESQLRQKATELETLLRELQHAQSQLIQSEKMASLGQLVAGVAHEINNPINFIYGNINPAIEYASDLIDSIELYQQHYPDPDEDIADAAEEMDLEFLKSDFPKLLDSMKLGAERISEIVKSLRTFSRFDEAELKPVDLHQGIDSTLTILENRLKPRSDRKAIEVIREYGSLPPVECYPGQFNQAMMNILANAIDVLDKMSDRDELPRTPKIWIRTATIEGDRVSITIEDNGSGMPDSVRSRVFDPFFTTKAVGKGTGLGLAISHSVIVERHGGTIRCHSQPGIGTKFTIEIPLKQGLT
jgi:PAS domain S-box-containing protein